MTTRKKMLKSINFSFDHASESESDKHINERIRDEIQSMVDQLEYIKDSVEERFEKQSRDVSSNWDSKWSDIVPGDVLIDNVCKKYGVRFIKRRDGERLASVIKANDIDQEINNLIYEIDSK